MEIGEEKKGNTTDAAHGIFLLPDDAQCFSVNYSTELIMYICILFIYIFKYLYNMQVLEWVCNSLVNACYGWMCYGKTYAEDGFKIFWKENISHLLQRDVGILRLC